MTLRQKLFNKQFIKRLVPYFFMVTTLLIVVFNDFFGKEEDYHIYILLFFMSMIVWMIRWLIIQIKIILRLKKDKTQAELMHLKSQVNPHFFFNTLNNLYGLIIEKSEDAPNVVLKLSEIMRYTIYMGKEDIIPLKDEIEYLRNYIELHKIRYQKRVDISFNHEGQAEYKIAPLLFIIPLENAFKHGVANDKEDPIKINIIANQKIKFLVV